MRIVFFGSGAFGLPTLEHLRAHHEVVQVISQPDRPAGRKRVLTPTPVAAAAIDAGLPLMRPACVNAADRCDDIRALEADAWVVIAFGQKLGEALLADRFAINLHGSLLPRWRGAAPIHHAVMAGDDLTGVSVITLAAVMDAGAVLGTAARPIDSTDTTGILHDALAALGPDVVGDVLNAHEAGTLEPRLQADDEVTLAPKLSRADATLDLQAPADVVRRHINGLSPWPGCQVHIDSVAVRLLRAGPSNATVGTGMVDAHGQLGCGDGAVALLQVQPAGGRPMPWSAFANGRRLQGEHGVQS